MRRSRRRRPLGRVSRSEVSFEPVGEAMSPKRARARTRPAPRPGHRRRSDVVRGTTRLPRGVVVGVLGVAWQGDNREQGEQAGFGAGDRLVQPLPLGLDAKMAADFMEGHLDAPALHEPRDDRGRLARQVGAEQRLGWDAIRGIADEHSADRHDRLAAVSLHRGARRNLDGARPRPVPARHHDRVPMRVLVREGRDERRQPRSLGAGASDHAWSARRGGFIERRIEPQAGDRREAGAAWR